MVDSIFGSGIRPGPIGIPVKARSPNVWLYTPRRKDLVKVFELVVLRNKIKATMPRFSECSEDMVLFLNRVLGPYSKRILGNYSPIFVSKLYNSKPLSTYVVYKKNDKIDYDIINSYYKAKIRGYAIKGEKNRNYLYQNVKRLKPGMLIHEAKTVGGSGFEKKHLVMWLGWINSLGGAYYFDSRYPKLHKYDDKKNFVSSSISSYDFWRIVVIYDPWHGRE